MKQPSAYFGAVLILGLFAVSRTGAEEPKKPAAPPTGAVSYFKEIRPVFQANCQGCHQPAKAMGEFVMTSFDGLRKGGESGHAAIVPGKPDESNLITQIVPKDGKAEMPRDKPPLPADQIARIRQWVAEAAQDDTPASVRTVIDMEHPPVYEAPPVLTSLSFSPDGSLLAISGYHEVLVYSGDGSTLVTRLVGQSERIEAAMFSPDGKSLAVSGGSPGRLGEVQVWDIATRKLRLSLPVTYDTVYGASWSFDGTKIAFGCADNTVRAIDSVTGKQVLYQGAHDDWVLDTVFSQDAKYLISVGRDRSMKLVEVATQRFVDNITSITPGALKGGLATVDRRPKTDQLLIGGADGIPKTYQMLRTKARVIGDDYNQIKAYEAMPGRIYSVRFNPDGTRFVAGSSFEGAGEVRIYETDSGKLLFKFTDPGPVFAVAFSPNGKVVAAGGFDGIVRLYDAEAGKLLKQFSPVPAVPPKVAVRN